MMFFTSLVQSTWEVVLIAPTGGLINGGLAGLFWGYIWTFIGFIFIVVSLAEMASMAPTSGGQYHWVSEFAPARSQKFLSYMSGWMASLSWLAGTAGGSFIIGTLIQGLLSAYQPSYVPKKWQGTLFVFATSIAEGLINIYGVNFLPSLQTVMMVPHGLGWIAVMIFLGVLAEHTSAHDVFLNFTSNGGWEPIGLSVMVGQITSVYFLILSDSAAHLAEEVKTASIAVPRAMIWSFVLNGIVGFGMLVALLFTITSIDDILDPTVNPSGFALIYIFQKASYKGAIPLIAMIMAVSFTGVVDSNASTSREVFAFARDGGFPFQSYLSRVKKTRTTTVPQNAIMLTCVVTCLLALINLGSTVAFNAIISLQLMALMATYSLSIGCVLYHRVIGNSLPLARWSLGRWGTPINAIAFVYSVFILFWTGWPGAKDVTAETFNWSSVMFVGIFIISLVFYAIYGRHQYQGPVLLVRNDGNTLLASKS
jgi:choline transport protein